MSKRLHNFVTVTFVGQYITMYLYNSVIQNGTGEGSSTQALISHISKKERLST